MAERSVGNTLKNLVLALLNATLILVALCLWLGWSLLGTLDRVTERVSDSVAQIAPVASGIKDVSGEIAGMRADVRGLRDSSTGSNAAAVAKLAAQVTQLDTRLADIQTQVQSVTASPEALIDHAIDAAAERFAQALKSVLMSLRG